MGCGTSKPASAGVADKGSGPTAAAHADAGTSSSSSVPAAGGPMRTDDNGDLSRNPLASVFRAGEPVEASSTGGQWGAGGVGGATVESLGGVREGETRDDDHHCGFAQAAGARTAGACLRWPTSPRERWTRPRCTVSADRASTTHAHARAACGGRQERWGVRRALSCDELAARVAASVLDTGWAAAWLRWAERRCRGAAKPGHTTVLARPQPPHARFFFFFSLSIPVSHCPPLVGVGVFVSSARCVALRVPSLCTRMAGLQSA